MNISVLHIVPEQTIHCSAQKFGLEISERVPIQMTATPYDLFYLKTKQARMGHLLEY